MSIATYTAFQEKLAATPQTGRLMPYNWHKLPDPLGIQWLAYSQMLQEFAPELANSINHFTHHVRHLQAWAEVIDVFSAQEKFQATHDFIDVLATISVNLPYVIRSRFIFATAHLCHQANRRRAPAWKDDLKLDGKIYKEEADRCGASWRAYKRLNRRLDAIAGKAFRKATHDFRNAYNHRFSPRFVVGITNVVKRMVDTDTGRICYTFGGLEPLDLRSVASILVVERDRCYEAFAAFQNLVSEHAAEIERTSEPQ